MRNETEAVPDVAGLAQPRQFTTLNHPEPDEDDGVQYYTLYECFDDNAEGSIDGTSYITIDGKITAEAAAIFINANGIIQADA